MARVGSLTGASVVDAPFFMGDTAGLWQNYFSYLKVIDLK